MLGPSFRPLPPPFGYCPAGRVGLVVEEDGTNGFFPEELPAQEGISC
jgi:hypothetical protein